MLAETENEINGPTAIAQNALKNGSAACISCFAMAL
jgi:hypothetical protein